MLNTRLTLSCLRSRNTALLQPPTSSIRATTSKIFKRRQHALPKSKPAPRVPPPHQSPVGNSDRGLKPTTRGYGPIVANRRCHQRIPAFCTAETPTMTRRPFLSSQEAGHRDSVSTRKVHAEVKEKIHSLEAPSQPATRFHLGHDVDQNVASTPCIHGGKKRGCCMGYSQNTNPCDCESGL